MANFIKRVLCKYGFHAWDMWSISNWGDKKYRCKRCKAQATN